jgi:cobalt/nickel transport system permease protein
MTHIMVPDGVFPLWLWGLGWVATAVLVALIGWRTNQSDMMQKVPLIGVMAALMTVAMSFALVPIAYEPHLTVLAGIMLGPVYGFIAGLVFMILRWLMGDGAITLIGINTLLIGAEIALGYALFHVLLKAFARRASFSAGVSAFLSLALTTALFLGVVAAANINPLQGEMGELGAYDIETGTLQRPFAEGVVALHVFEDHDEEHEEGPEIAGSSPFAVFARAVLLLGLIGWILESVLVGLIVGFLVRVRRDLILPPRAPAANE